MNEQRPRQVTVAAWLIMLGGAAVIVTAYQQMATLHSMATREAVQKWLSSAPFGPSTFGVGDVLTALHVLALVAGACAAASVVLGWYALQGSRPARIALSVLAVPLLVSGLGGGGIFSTVVAVAALLLWMPPAREWFRGEPLPTPPAPEAEPPPAAPVQAPPPQSQPPAGVQPPPPYPPSHGWQPFPPAWHPSYASRPPHLTQRSIQRRIQRPAAVVTAVLLTWIFSALSVLLMVGSCAYVLSDQTGVWRRALAQSPQLADRGVTPHELATMVCVMAALVVVWCVATAVVSVFVWRGAAWARTTAIVLVSISLAALVFTVIVSVVALVPASAAVVTIVGLSRVEAREWCRG